MAHVILGHCCKDASCVSACPRDCIRPRPGDAGFAAAQTLHIDPEACIDCTACVDACPASAIKPDYALTPAEQRHARRNSDYFARTELPATTNTRLATPFSRPLTDPGRTVRIAVVGSGPAAMYTVRELLRRSSAVHVTVYERQDRVGGLLRTAVSLDHTGLREVLRLFDVPFNDDRVRVVYNTEVGRDLAIEALRRQFDAVVLAHGASIPRPIASADLSLPHGVHEALDILTGANHPTPAMVRPRDLGPRCLIVGAGNVALDVIRYLAREHAAAPGAVREVTVLSRSAANRAASAPAMMADILSLPDLSVRAAEVPEHSGGNETDSVWEAWPGHRGDRLRLTFSRGQHVTNIERTDTGELIAHTAAGRSFAADAVVRATGFVTAQIDGLPDSSNGAVPNHKGRIISPATGHPLTGLYVVGWAKRGARGGIGENRFCATETVEQLTTDLRSAARID